MPDHVHVHAHHLDRETMEVDDTGIERVRITIGRFNFYIIDAALSLLWKTVNMPLHWVFMIKFQKFPKVLYGGYYGDIWKQRNIFLCMLCFFPSVSSNNNTIL